MRHIAPRHTLEVVLEVTLEVILKHMCSPADVAEWLDRRLK
jgi:hypothetical protein